MNWRISPEFDLDFGMDVDYVVGRGYHGSSSPKEGQPEEAQGCRVRNCFPLRIRMVR